jgi:hypothetical protein
LRCVGQDAVDLIQSEEPFSTGEGVYSPLWHLQELSNADKHRTLHLTGTQLAAFSFNFPALLEDCAQTTLEVAQKGPL